MGAQGVVEVSNSDVSLIAAGTSIATAATSSDIDVAQWGSAGLNATLTKGDAAVAVLTLTLYSVDPAGSAFLLSKVDSSDVWTPAAPVRTTAASADTVRLHLPIDVTNVRELRVVASRTGGHASDTIEITSTLGRGV